MPEDRLGRYELIDVIDRGAMGVVYRAYDPLIGRTVAIKTIECSGLSRDELATFERRFFREAKSAGQLNHPNIVTIHEVGREGDHAYMVMEFINGRSLRSILDSGLVLSESQIIDIAEQVACGLAAAHAGEVVHRDIKPANIVVLENGAVKITDFGVALIPHGSTTHAGTVLGSPKYMSPEQILGKEVDGRSDIFALGVVLYEMLTGKPPFEGDDLAAILHAILNTTPPAPSSRRRQTHPGFDRIVAKALAKDPADRYQTAYEMAEDLEACLPRPSEPGSSQPLRDIGHRSPRIGITIAGLAAIFAIAFGGWLGLHAKRAEPPRAAIPPPIVKAEAPPVAKEIAPPEVKEPARQAAKAPVPMATKAKPQQATKRAPAPVVRKPAQQTARFAPQPTNRERPQSGAAPAAAAPDKKWEKMREELAACGTFNIFCQAKVRWRHCKDNWGKVPDCPNNATNDSLGGLPN